MRTGIAYTCARILLLVAALVLLDLAGARGIVLLALAFGVSALASYVLLSRQRDVLSGMLSRRLSRVSGKAAEFRARLEEGAAAEDAAGDENVDENVDEAGDENADGEPSARPASRRG